jgi:hypothetical protein
VLNRVMFGNAYVYACFEASAVCATHAYFLEKGEEFQLYHCIWSLFKITNSYVMISGFPRQVDEICAPLGYYAAYSDNSLQTFRDNLSIPSSRFTLRCVITQKSADLVYPVPVYA